MDPKTIFHVDLDAFFASVETLKNPSLKGKPVIVGGSPERRGVVATCSYEARKFGVRSAMSVAEAKRLCPQGIFLETSFSLYRDYSDKVMTILEQFSDAIQIIGIDEAYLDVTEVCSVYDGAFHLGQAIRRTVFHDTGLTCSIGIGANKLIAKIASSLAKPNGLYEVPAGHEARFLAPLPIQALPGIGSKTQAFLNQQGLKHVSDLQSQGVEELVNRYGAIGYYFSKASQGQGNDVVEIDDGSPKSVGAETTFEQDHHEEEFLLLALEELVQKAYNRLIRYKMRTRGIRLKLRFSNFHTITRSHVLNADTNDYSLLFHEAIQLFRRSFEGAPLRLLGITFERLTDNYWQPTFWDWLKEQSFDIG
jgi:nucleotidyltransferase/DNA polymerase involved in DNA repair